MKGESKTRTERRRKLENEQNQRRKAIIPTLKALEKLRTKF